ncbi:transposon-encoded TnpW family protein [Ruminococcus albus]|uniref:transposon-encoded TnpW family protein n=1 Tax=Ruminococcus albus TaxID=1264 RepID=UPI0002D7457B|nr:transposon-encoded TnpW family protein [Ruminococcus albus]
MNRKTTEQTDKIKPIERKITIGNMTYIVVSHFSETSTDTAEDKIERLIKRDING